MSANPKAVQATGREFVLLIDGRLIPGARSLEVMNRANG